LPATLIANQIVEASITLVASLQFIARLVTEVADEVISGIRRKYFEIRGINFIWNRKSKEAVFDFVSIVSIVSIVLVY
jgi:hypothetical protein